MLVDIYCFCICLIYLTLLPIHRAGKSTLLNLIMDKLTPNKGSISRNGNLRIGHFTQHSADKFDLQLSAVENMLNLFEGTDDQLMRSFLGKFQIQGTDALKPMMMLSGGQKSRVAFASLSYQKPHVIVMDEPTNHLGMFHYYLSSTSCLLSTFLTLLCITH